MTEVLPSVAAAEGTALYAWLLVALPAFGALVLLAGGRRTNAWGHLLGCATVLAASATAWRCSPRRWVSTRRSGPESWGWVPSSRSTPCRSTTVYGLIRCR